jgi:hypothetical protein
LNDGEWHLGHAVVDGSTYRLYTDGAASGNGAYGPPGSYSGDRKVFSHVDDNLYWTGDMDEIRIYAGALSADWIATEFNNQDDPDAFFDVGAEQAASLFKVGSLFALFQ